MDKIPCCELCGEHFDNIFEATDHLVEDGGEQPFDPRMRLPNGYSLMIGSLLRQIFHCADEATEVKRIVEMTYATLFAAEHDTHEMKRLVEEAIVHEHMSAFDSQLEHLLDGDKNDG